MSAFDDIVGFEEETGSPLYSGTRTELNATRVGIIPWANINILYAALFPPPTLFYGSRPARMPGSALLYADSVSFAPLFNDDVQINNSRVDGIPSLYAQCRATIQYKTIPYSGGDDRPLVTYRASVSAEFLTLPMVGLKWANGDAVTGEDVSAGKLIPMIEHQYTIHSVPGQPGVPLPNYAKVRAMIGMVNSTNFLGAPPETVLFSGADFTQEVSTGGSDSDGTQAPWTVELKFSERNFWQGTQQYGWNHFFRTDGSGSGSWQILQVKGGGTPQKVYTSGDLNQVLS